MQQIVDGVKNYEFRKYRLKPSAQRVWFYRTARYSSIDYICEILPAATRNPGDPRGEWTGQSGIQYARQGLGAV